MRRTAEVCLSRATCASLRGGGSGNGPAPGAAGGADAEAAVGEGEQAAERHDERAEPDQPHERVEVEAHDEAAAGEFIAKDGVEIAAPGHMDGRFRGGLAWRVVGALGGAELGDRSAAARDRQNADLILVVRTLGGRSAAEGKLVAGDLRRCRRASSTARPRSARRWWRRCRSRRGRCRRAQAWCRRPRGAGRGRGGRLSASGALNSFTRLVHSDSAPATTQTPSAMPKGASQGPRQ